MTATNVKLLTYATAGALLAGVATAQDHQPVRSVSFVSSPLTLVEADASDVATIRFDAAVQPELQAGGELLRVEDFVLPGNRSVDLVLRSVSAMEEGGTAIVVNADGTTSRMAPSVSMYSGYDVQTGGTAFLAVSSTMLNGYVSVDGELYILSSGGATTSGTATIAHASAFGDSIPQDNWCNVVGDFTQADEGQIGVEAGAGHVVRLGDYFVEADHQYRNLFASDQDCIDYTVTLITANSEVYRRDIGVVTSIPSGYLRVWNSVPPWGVISDFGHISNVQAWWTSGANPDVNLPRVSVHVLTNPVFGGVAWNIGGVCDNSQSYHVSSVFGFFPYPIQHQSSDNWDLFVVAHEYGHSHGGPHTFSLSPPIACDDGSGPDNGTIMSYCHGEPGGVANVGMRFHARLQDLMRIEVNSVSCFNVLPILPGDYDYDNDRDLSDLAALNQYLSQGFASAGSLETFDMDGNGVVDDCDREFLIAVINGNPAASATVRNGSGVNNLCFSTLTQPVMGTDWDSQVDASSHAGAAFSWLLGYPLPASIPLGIGEVLVDLTSGQIMFSVGGPGQNVHPHTVAIPKDVALSGYVLSTQAAITGGFIELCNALDLVIEFY